MIEFMNNLFSLTASTFSTDIMRTIIIFSSLAMLGRLVWWVLRLKTRSNYKNNYMKGDD